MTGWGSLVVLMVAALAMLALACSLALAVAVRFGRRWLERAAMAGRIRLLLVLAIAPMLVGAVIMALCLAPSALAALGLMSDHCVTSFHDHLHLCLRHLPTIGPGNMAWLLTLIAAAALGRAVFSAAQALTKGMGVARSLATLVDGAPSSKSPRATFRDALPGDALPTGARVGWIDSRACLSLTAGLLKPRVFISRGLANALDYDELGAAIAHERCHARERHSLVKLLAMCGSTLHGPRTRRALLELLALACERRADESAATEIGDRLPVASAIIRAHRVAPLPPLVLALSGHGALEKRVRALLAPPTQPPRTTRRWVLTLAAAATIACFEVHHAVEVALSLLV